MPAQFAATIHALNKGATSRSVKAAIKKIENWEESLRTVQATGTRVIIRDLGALKRQLDRQKPDVERVQKIVSRLAEAAGKAGAKLRGREAAKVRDLGSNMRDAREGENAKGGQRPAQRAAPSRASRKSSSPGEDEGQTLKSTGGSRKIASRYERSSRYGEDEDDRRGPGGRVRDPEHDHRLRGHETGRVYESRHRGDDGRGRVIDPEHDHRLRGQESERLYESRHRGDDGRGRVIDPEYDHRLRGHESERLYESRHRGDDGRGEVRDPEHDHRLRGHESERLYESRHRGDDGRGRVIDPEHDRRLLPEHRGVRYEEDEDYRGRSRSRSRYEDEDYEPRRSRRSSSRYDEDDDVRSGGQGRVKDPEHDMRLSRNRR